MKNKLIDLNNHLFEQMERLNDDDLTEDQMMIEVHRTKAMTRVAQSIIQNGTLLLNAKKYVDEYNVEIPLLTSEK